MKRQILMSILIISVTFMLMGTGTYAHFQYAGGLRQIHFYDHTSSNILYIRDNDECWGHGVKATWTAEDMKPGFEYPFICKYIGLKTSCCSLKLDHIKITCSYTVKDNDQTEADTDWNTDQHPDSMAKYMIITRCKYVRGCSPQANINCLTDSNLDRRIEDKDGDGKITFYDFKNDPLNNLPPPGGCCGEAKFELSVKFDENAGNEFQGDVFDLTFAFIAIE